MQATPQSYHSNIMAREVRQSQGLMGLRPLGFLGKAKDMIKITNLIYRAHFKLVQLY